MHEGVEVCGRVDIVVVVMEWVGERRSYRDIVRSVDAAKAVCPSEVKAMSKKGFSGAVCEQHQKSDINNIEKKTLSGTNTHDRIRTKSILYIPHPNRRIESTTIRSPFNPTKLTAKQRARNP